ncbi:hypothetical protein LNJ40_06885 [Tenacibaculum dicentrarchi]|nr:hypothetical protein [Tenacibaculum dicentrarchi]
MTAFANFNKELKRLREFYQATIYAYNQTDYFLMLKKQHSKELINLDIKIEKQPNFYRKKKSNTTSVNEKNLSEIIFIRVITALEVYMRDSILEIFKKNKLPFKKLEKDLKFNYKELLSFKSTADIINKLIKSELREVKNGGITELVKYYNNTFGLNISITSPEFKKLLKYHDQRHIFVHRLGKTDDIYRKKYESINSLSIDEDYLMTCINDFTAFGNQIEELLEIQFENEYYKIQQSRKPEKKIRFSVEILKGKPEIFNYNYEFWIDDQPVMFGNILRNREDIDPKKFIISVAGKNRVIENYIKIVDKFASKNKIKVEYLIKKKKQLPLLSKETLFKIKEQLPSIPWGINIIDEISNELNLSKRDVCRGLVYFNKTEFENMQKRKAT